MTCTICFIRLVLLSFTEMMATMSGVSVGIVTSMAPAMSFPIHQRDTSAGRQCLKGWRGNVLSLGTAECLGRSLWVLGLG